MVQTQRGRNKNTSRHPTAAPAITYRIPLSSPIRCDVVNPGHKHTLGGHIVFAGEMNLNVE